MCERCGKPRGNSPNGRECRTCWRERMGIGEPSNVAALNTFRTFKMTGPRK